MDTIITNPYQSHRTTTDFTTGKYADGGVHEYYQRIVNFRANATITRGQALMHVVPTTTVPLSVTPMTAAISASDSWMFAGAALEPAAAGDICPVLVEGYGVVVTEDADTPTALHVLLAPDTTTGAFAAAADAIAGQTVVGKVLGPEIGTTNTAFAYIGWVAVEHVVNT